MIRSTVRSQFCPSPSVAPLATLVRAISQACNLQLLEYHAQTAVMALGCDYFVLVSPPPCHASEPVLPVLSSPTDEVWDAFLSRGLQCSQAEMVEALDGNCGVVFAVAGRRAGHDARTGGSIDVAGGALVRVASAAERETMLVVYCQDSVPPPGIVGPLAMIGAALSVRLLGLHDTGVTRTLSEMQAEILHWAAAGKSNGDIATILGISRRGCDYHMGEIYRKLGVSSRSQAVAAYSQGDVERSANLVSPLSH